MKRCAIGLFLTLVFAGMISCFAAPLHPEIAGPWWTIASSPDLGELTSPKQEPVDFAVWQASDGRWQLWSCIRNTKEAGRTRLLYHWEGPSLTNTDWKPLGIALRADAKYGETPGGLQAPFVMREGNLFYMFYGDWEGICLATSTDGKTFTRHTNLGGETALFTEGRGNNTRDPMVLRSGDLWHCYYTAYPDNKGADYCRTSKDLLHWSDSHVVAFGGQAGTGRYSSECPFVVSPKRGDYFLFRTQRYGKDAKTSVYYSKNPMEFGVNADQQHFVCTLPVAAPEIIFHDGEYYIAALLPSLKGIQVAKLRWVASQ